jgi:hypothetical protein
MEQDLNYKGIRYIIGVDKGQGRSWVIYPDDGPAEGAALGQARITGPRGSFKEAVIAAREAIDEWLLHHPVADNTGS